MAATATTSSVAIETNTPNIGWLRNSVFDFHFIVSIAVLALATGSCALIRPDLFQLFILLDVWLLGYHHVVSTFTRLVFDRSSFQENRFLVIHLPIIVVACTLAAIWLLGTWVIATTYLYWQWFHYTRQSYGVERMYRRKAGEDTDIDDYVATRALYMLPIFGIFYRSWQQPAKFIGMDVFALTVPFPLLVAVGIVTALALSVWAAQQLSAYRQGRLATAHCRYMLSHFVIFLFGYVLISDITAGWLVINIWHNFQYILFVWWFNNKRFEKGIDPKSQFLSTISQRENMLIYMGLCLAISTVVYVALTGATAAYRTSTVSLTVIVLMMLNFHHYVVDGIIWKRKRTKAKPAAAASA